VAGIEELKLDFATLKRRRDSYVEMLNGVYEKLVNGSKVKLIRGWAKFVNNKTVEVNGTDRYTADHILIATGGCPKTIGYEGEEHAINSDGFFDIEELPKKVVVYGSGYIGTELGQILHAFGTKVIQVARNDLLAFVDDEVRDTLLESMKINNYDFRSGLTIEKIEKISNKNLNVHFSDGTVEENVEYMLSAVGRKPNTENLGLETTDIQVNKAGYIAVDEFEATTVEGVYAIGDVIGKIELTPVAIRAGRTLVERLFNNRPGLKMDYENVPTVIFSHPPIGMIGLTEKQAKEKFGEENVGVYKSKFTNMFYSLIEDAEKKPKTLIKYITNKLDDERVIGVHLCGRNADEMLQGVGIAVKMGATKKDFDRCVAIHPTGSEEFVLCDPAI